MKMVGIAKAKVHPSRTGPLFSSETGSVEFAAMAAGVAEPTGHEKCSSTAWCAQDAEASELRLRSMSPGAVEMSLSRKGGGVGVISEVVKVTWAIILRRNNNNTLGRYGIV
jgi:hypothetical protein